MISVAEINEWTSKSRKEGLCVIVDCYNKPITKCKKCTNYYCHEHFKSHLDLLPDEEVDYEEMEDNSFRLLYIVCCY
jgi:hypothetical protein